MISKNKKIRVAVLFGGKSAEHEASLQSAKNIIEAIDKEKYEVVLIGIDNKGRWLLNNSKHYLLNSDNPKLIRLNTSNKKVSISPGTVSSQIMTASQGGFVGQIDVVFPVLHGPYGEDGSMQGLLKIMDLPFVGSGVLGSAVGMDKDVSKRLLRDAGLPVANFMVFYKGVTLSFDAVRKKLGIPFFVKPANLGSSVGVSKIKNKKDFKKAVDEAFAYDNKILFEEFIPGREIELSVLGNEEPIVSIPGEIVVKHDFYSYQAKYIDPDGASLEVPAKLPKKKVKEFQRLAIAVFKVLCIEGMARVDFRMENNGKIYVNEANTIPGFTNISMYPKLWEASGIEYRELVDRLITLAIERHRKQEKLKTSL